MENYRRLSDQELIQMLQLYNIPHGPIVGSTRKLYEKKVYEYESQRTTMNPGPSSSPCGYTEPTKGESEDKDNEDEDGDVDMEDVDNENYYIECFSSTKPYGETDAASSSPVRARTTYRPTIQSYGVVSARMPTQQQFQYSLPQDDPVASSVVSSSLGSLSPPTFTWPLSPPKVTTRQAIRPDQTRWAEVAAHDRLVPLWLQLLLFAAFALFLAFFYYFMQADDNNPFCLQQP